MNGAEEILAIAKGTSMLPVLRTGDRVRLRPVKRESLRCGDILAFTTADGREIVHRVVRLAPLQTRGDNCRDDDPPVPEGAPLFLALSYCRNGGSVVLSSGRSGIKEFRRSQIRRRVFAFLRKLLVPIAGCNPVRVSSRQLTTAVFQGKTVYYAWKYPVGWVDETGWHWMRFARFFVENPSEKTLE